MPPTSNSLTKRVSVPTSMNDFLDAAITKSTSLHSRKIQSSRVCSEVYFEPVPSGITECQENSQTRINGRVKSLQLSKSSFTRGRAAPWTSMGSAPTPFCPLPHTARPSRLRVRRRQAALRGNSASLTPSDAVASIVRRDLRCKSGGISGRSCGAACFV